MEDSREYYVGATIESEERGFFTIVHSHFFDGNVADVYGETQEEAEDMAHYIVQCLNLLDEVHNLKDIKNVRQDPATGNIIVEVK